MMDSSFSKKSSFKGRFTRYSHHGVDKVKEIEKQGIMINLDIGPLHPSRKTIKKGVEFTIMVIGASGLGKSTLVNTLFNTDMFSAHATGDLTKPQKTVEILSSTVELEERSTKIRLTIIDTPGFDDSLDNSNCIKPISDYIDQQLDNYFHDETGLNRRNIIDGRVHCCLYFIEPMSRGLKKLDIECMKAIHDRVNIVPLLAKGDAYSNEELALMKQMVIKDLVENGIKIYEFPECDPEDDPEFIKLNDHFKKLIPFSIVGSVDTIEMAGKIIRGRSYPWGFVNVDEESHCDFIPLRSMLLRTHINDLKDITEEVHYENYRALVLTKGGQFDFFSGEYNPNELSIIGNSTMSERGKTFTAQKNDEANKIREMVAKLHNAKEI